MACPRAVWVAFRARRLTLSTGAFRVFSLVQPQGAGVQVDNDQNSDKSRPTTNEIASILARIEKEPIPQRLLELALQLQKALRDAKKAQ